MAFFVSDWHSAVNPCQQACIPPLPIYIYTDRFCPDPLFFNPLANSATGVKI